ncbi:hypothetical protein MNBD_PLANCTO03-448 [hydrothermal vent metagenome]|uniref:Uncharacterized protein n=1 Tax=hydrothermal vent metagenome TaxID=652676 RepID=A0A3B1E6B2_9ZZZZ
MTTFAVPDALVSKTRAARAQAEVLLAGLREASAASEQRLAEASRTDPLKQVTGRSSLENAIEATRHMIETLDRNLAELEGEVEREGLQSNGCVIVPGTGAASTVSA